MSRALAASILILIALAPAALAQGLDLQVRGLPVAIRQDVPLPVYGIAGVPLAGPVVLDPIATADAVQPRADPPAAPRHDPAPDAPASSSEPSSPSDPAPLLASIPVPLTTAGAVPLVDGLVSTIPVGLGPLLAAPQEGFAPTAASAPTESVATAAAAPVAPLAATSAATAGASLVAVAAVSVAAPVAPLGWDRLKRILLPLALYTRIAKERLLDHGSREKLLAAIRERPGLPVTDLADAAGVPRNTATYHLRRLEREGVVVSQRSGRVRVWFVPGGPARRDEAPAYAALRHETTRAIAMTVVAEPGVDQQALCARLGLAPSLAHWHADRLVSSGLVRKERDGRRVRYYPTEGLPRVAAISG